MPGQSGYISLSESYCSSKECSHHSMSSHFFHRLLLRLSLSPAVCVFTLILSSFCKPLDTTPSHFPFPFLPFSLCTQGTKRLRAWCRCTDSSENARHKRLTAQSWAGRRRCNLHNILIRKHMIHLLDAADFSIVQLYPSWAMCASWQCCHHDR